MSFKKILFKKKLRDALILSMSGTVAFLGIGAYMNNPEIYRSVIMPLFHKLDPETAHNCSIIAAKYKLIKQTPIKSCKSLEINVRGLKFANPIGLAAGYDKNGEAVEGLFQMGFGFVEVGSVTPLPQPGNPAPRVFRIQPLKAIINRYGFNSHGHDVVFERLSKLPPPGQRRGILGVNLGKNKESIDPVNDYVLGVRKFAPVADYLVINISSPNTPGLRNMQRKEELETLTAAVLKERNNLMTSSHHPPLFLKVSPDLTIESKRDIAEVVLLEKYRVDGLIVSNTTTSRPLEVDHPHITETGGLSGEPLRALANQTLKDMALMTRGEMPIIGVGGVSSGADAVEKLRLGASLVQLYSAFAYEGPPIVSRIASELEDELRKGGFSDVNAAIGTKLKS